MIVYVDNMNAPYGRMYLSHMYADSVEELHSMADKIGMKRKWFQDKPGFPHYDICKSKKELALKEGAVSVTSRELVKIVRNR